MNSRQGSHNLPLCEGSSTLVQSASPRTSLPSLPLRSNLPCWGPYRLHRIANSRTAMVSPYRAKNLSHLPGVQHGFFTNEGGVSTGPAFASLNCSLSQDARSNVLENRRRVAAHLGAPDEFIYIPSLCHSADAVFVDFSSRRDEVPSADGVVTTSKQLALGVLGADCAPVLFADRAAGVVGACHSGWRGALNGVIENTVSLMVAHGALPERIVAAVGPCIQQPWYEVGPEFEQRFLDIDAGNQQFFTVPPGAKKAHFDLAAYVVERLKRAGVTDIENLALCTRGNDQFFSFRRHSALGIKGFGCQASAIMLTNDEGSSTPRGIQDRSW